MKLDIIMHYSVNETTGEIVFLGKDEIKVDTAKKTTTSSFKSKVTKSRANLKSANKRVQQTTKKKATNTTKRTQSKFQKSFSNLKKNIKKLFGWR